MQLHDWAGLELRHLIALQAVAEERSFGRAADRLGYTQSAVSHQIAALEGLVGERVIERGRGQRSIELTQAGALLARHADAIVARLRAAQADYAAFTEGAAGLLRVGIYQSVGTRILPTLMREFATAWPRVEVQLTEDSADGRLR
jgi:DNA-binding transcriptional LysR family regulator